MGAARRCFARKGFHAASTAEISAEAGVSVANLYQYFSTKDDLMIALIEDDLLEDLKILGMLVNTESVTEALKAAGAWIANADAGGEQHPIRLDILAETFRRPDIADAVRRAESEIVGALATVIEKAKARREIAADVDAHETAALIMAFTDGLLSRIALRPQTFSKMAAAFVDFVGRALGLAPINGRSPERAFAELDREDD